MPLHSLGSGNISFGLVSIPVRLYTATSSKSVAFNQLHAKCGTRIRQQMVCPQCDTVVDRSELVRGYEFAKDQYVQLTEDELDALEGEATKAIDISEFVPLPKVDPIYFDRTYYLGPDKGGEKAYRLLAEAMAESDKVALATFVMRGKEHLVLLRAANGGLLLHTMYFADEIRDFAEVDKGEGAKIKEGELGLARRLNEELSGEHFQPERYQDDYRNRVLAVIEEKVQGKEISVSAPAPKEARVIDLMEALKESLTRRAAQEKRPAASASRAAPAPAKRPESRPKKVQSSRR